MIYAEINFHNEEEIIQVYFQYLPRIGEKVWIPGDDETSSVRFLVKDVEHLINRRSRPEIGVDQKVSILAVRITNTI